MLINFAEPLVPPADAASAEELARSSVEFHARGCWEEADRCLDRAQELCPPHHVAPVAPYEFKREVWEQTRPGNPEWGALNLLDYSRRQPTGARQVFAEYYAQSIGEVVPVGQRDPFDRLQYLPLDFLSDKSVLDVGGNCGGMLHAVAGGARAASMGLRWGVGTDCDARMVNAANRIAACRGAGLLRFYVHDLEEDLLDLLADFMPEPRADVVLLLSVCAHVRNWRAVIAHCAGLADEMVFEANGAEHEQLGQLRALWRAYGEVVELAGRGAPGIGARRLYLCKSPK